MNVGDIVTDNHYRYAQRGFYIRGVYEIVGPMNEINRTDLILIKNLLTLHVTYVPKSIVRLATDEEIAKAISEKISGVYDR